MSRFNNRPVYIVELHHSDDVIEHNIAPGLFRQYVDDGLIVAKARYRAKVSPRYYAYVDFEMNTLRFISLAEIAMLGGGSVAPLYYRLWLYKVKYDRDGDPVYSGEHERQNQAPARSASVETADYYHRFQDSRTRVCAWPRVTTG